MGRELIMYTVYDNPTDYPGKYVVRRWKLLNAEADPLIVADTLEEARAAIPPHLFCIPRQPEDDRAVKEVWI